MKRNFYIVGLIYLTFFVISFITNILGSLNPDVIKSFNLSLTLSALLPFAFFIAYGVMSIPAGFLVERFKEKNTMILAFIVSFSGALLLILFPSYIVFLISLFLMGSGMAMLQVAINPLLRVAGGEEHFAFNSVVAQLIFGAASFIAPLVLTFLLGNLSNSDSEGVLSKLLLNLVPDNLLWLSIYIVFTILLFVMIVIILLSKFPAVERKDDEIAGTWKTHRKMFKDKTVILFFIGIFAYVGTEQGVSFWMSKFLNVYHGFDPIDVGAKAVGWFWGMMSVGCLVGLILLKLFDSRFVLKAASMLSILLLCLGLFGSADLSLYSFPLIGFSISVMWSIIFSLALNSVETNHGSFAGILCTAIIGGAVVQLFIGWLGDILGLRAGMMFNFLTLAYILSIGFWAKPLIENETIRKTKIIEQES